MLRWPLLLVVALMATGAPSPARAFTPQTRIRIAERAMTLMPPALRRQLERHGRVLLLSALEPMRNGEGDGDHALHPEGGSADRALEDAARQALEALNTQASFAEVARAFGLVAHISADLAFPLNTSDADPREPGYYDDYAAYVESRLDRIPLIWDGWYDPRLAAGDPAGFARLAAAQSRRDYETIARAYHPEGRTSLPQDFDDRSNAFATASLSFSHAVGNTARAWMYIWNQAHGDRSGTPYLEPGQDPFTPPADTDGSTTP